MSYYNTRQTFFILSSTIKVEETEKIDKFLTLLLGYNIRKLFKFYSGKAKFEYWKAPVGLQPETFKKSSAKRLSKKANIIKNKSLNEEAKSKHKYK